MTGNPYQAPTSVGQAFGDKATKLSISETLPVWWSFVWRATIYGFVFGVLLGAIGGVFAAVRGVPEQAQMYGAALGYLGTIPASMLALKQALSKHLVSLAALIGQRA
ncbi:hypothetical protein J2X06_002928 [Lysobacter niastensis]|uniref:Uncharacterized protein n=1 Tax=Lysobacter niastensis TaxID=380629 RepID=A0ABU1W9C9_9GAMM|nr:hypothetical protein [Lysobacter niastensis]MDR7134049.1 hypothetical protein [Lysobacter niastensis]MDR7135719.1 hypothetical protein [Lysobacter niastensis]